MKGGRPDETENQMRLQKAENQYHQRRTAYPYRPFDTGCIQSAQTEQIPIPFAARPPNCFC